MWSVGAAKIYPATIFFSADVWIHATLAVFFVFFFTVMVRSSRDAQPPARKKNAKHYTTCFSSVESMDQKTFTSMVLHMCRVLKADAKNSINMNSYVQSMDYVVYTKHRNDIIGLAFVRLGAWRLKPEEYRDEGKGGMDTLYGNWLPCNMSFASATAHAQRHVFYSWNVRGLCVEPLHRRLGVASELMQVILRHARERDALHVELHVDKEPAHQCGWKVAFYQRLGFCALPARSNDYHLVWMNPGLL